MYKKSFILVSVILFVLCIFSGFVNAADAVKGTVSNITNTVVDGTVNLANDIRSGIGNAENGVEDAVKMDNVDNNDNNTNNTTNDNSVNNTTREDNVARNNDDYTATRTTAGGAMTDNTSTMWVWLVVAIAAIVIIGLVWYYGTQNNTIHHDD